eukprot:915173-Alexandrium_andersonii.AAC.1
MEAADGRASEHTHCSIHECASGQHESAAAAATAAEAAETRATAAVAEMPEGKATTALNNSL